MGWSAAARAAALQARKNKGITALKRVGNFSNSHGTSKPIVKPVNGGLQQVGLRTAFPAGALKATLSRVNAGAPGNPYKAVTVITSKGAFQASIGKRAFSSGGKALGLSRPSIGPGFNMTANRGGRK